MGEILRAENIKKTYGKLTVLNDISLTLNKGELVCILGVSGVGKTTLFNVLSGLTPADEGKVYINGEDVTGETGHISYMLQKDMLLPHKKVIDNVSLPMILSGKSKKESREYASQFFKQFGLDGTEYKYPHQLSGGMRQRAALLRTYLCGKDVALLDEPFSALDTITRSAVHEWYLSVMNDIKLSTLFITHDIDEAILLSDRIYILKGAPSSLAHEIVIDEPKPRSNNYILSESFINYKRKIKSYL
jgi:ABC-type nitrate/sulfonate/bicarbonate transport system, ATPase component